jgi:hypothetical protein
MYFALALTNEKSTSSSLCAFDGAAIVFRRRSRPIYPSNGTRADCKQCPVANLLQNQMHTTQPLLKILRQAVKENSRREMDVILRHVLLCHHCFFDNDRMLSSPFATRNAPLFPPNCVFAQAACCCIYPRGLITICRPVVAPRVAICINMCAGHLRDLENELLLIFFRLPRELFLHVTF